MGTLDITNMVMVQNPSTGEVIIQNRIKNWCGLTFPGGHVEDNETIYDSAVREIKEETGLDISDLKYCGLMYWFNNKTKDRYFTYFYKTTSYKGKLIEESDEGKVFWANIEQLNSDDFSPNFKEYLPMFFENKYSEAYCSYSDENLPRTIVYR